MPWCDGCAKYWTPNSVGDDGCCPRCDVQLVEARGAAAGSSTSATSASGDAAIDEKAPWHFKLLVVATSGYLIWRFVQIFA